MRRYATYDVHVIREVDKAEKSTKHFFKADIKKKVMGRTQVVEDIKRLTRLGLPGASTAVEQYISNKISVELQRRDENGIRVFECYKGNENERGRRYLPFKQMNLSELQAVMGHNARFKAAIARKGKRLGMWQKVMHGNAKVGEFYDEIVAFIKPQKKAS